MKRLFSIAYKFTTSPPTTPIKSLYRRPLPETYIRLNSTEGKTIFKEALAEGSMECYFPLAEQFITQVEPQTCGPTSLVMVLNSLYVDPGKQWKGIWRWYTQENLNLITKQILKQGVDLQSWTHLAQHNYLDVMTFYHPKARGAHESKDFCDIHKSWVYRTSSYDTFLDCVLASSRRDGFILTLNHSRKRMGQTGDGHFSPIGGYHRNRNLALMLDVARYKYPTYWCDTKLLFDSLEDMDKVTQKSRGFVLISRKLNPSGCSQSSNIDFEYVNLFHQNLAFLQENCHKYSRQDLISFFVQSFNLSMRSLMVYYLFQFGCLNSEEDKDSIYQSLKSHPIYQLVQQITNQNPSQNLNPNQNSVISNKQHLIRLIDDFTMERHKQIITLMLLSLPKSVLDINNLPISQKLKDNVKLFRKCFLIYLEQPKNYKFQ